MNGSNHYFRFATPKWFSTDSIAAFIAHPPPHYASYQTPRCIAPLQIYRLINDSCFRTSVLVSPTSPFCLFTKQMP